MPPLLVSLVSREKTERYSFELFCHKERQSSAAGVVLVNAKYDKDDNDDGGGGGVAFKRQQMTSSQSLESKKSLKFAGTVLWLATCEQIRCASASVSAIRMRLVGRNCVASVCLCLEEAL